MLLTDLTLLEHIHDPGIYATAKKKKKTLFDRFIATKAICEDIRLA